MHKPNFTEVNTLATKLAQPIERKRGPSAARIALLAEREAYRKRVPIAAHRAREAIRDFEAVNPGMLIEQIDTDTLGRLSANYCVNKAEMRLGFIPAYVREQGRRWNQ
ncbi:hypothetical protein [Paenirhodobacter populi]|uniref:Uncharacterized protein n=1 Tax=Paenirhodobacter populi TaxID=2306993 RepID=A0A443IJF7_9RHOB|nr:hypothetical protein [Sinirhodobacter populi]RWR04478.1 hypothetical protein D2T33_20985 [Sinirhodobacter populi]